MHQMTTKAAADKLKSDGWKIVDTSGFLHLVGPLWQRLVDGKHEYALITEDRHHNRSGLVQGGVLMTFADRTCGITARHVPVGYIPTLTRIPPAATVVPPRGR
jgi:acyl-coenzyme A thioesterase PaaI-like protein